MELPSVSYEARKTSLNYTQLPSLTLVREIPLSQNLTVKDLADFNLNGSWVCTELCFLLRRPLRHFLSLGIICNEKGQHAVAKIGDWTLC